MKATYNKKYEQLRREISKNLIRQKEQMGNVSTKRISKICYTSPSTAERWFKGEAIPDLPRLHILSDFFGCSIYNLIEPETEVPYYLINQLAEPATYADQVQFFLQLYNSNFTSFESMEQLSAIIDHPIVKFLITLYFKNLVLVRDQGVAGSELQEWFSQMIKDFSIPVSCASHRRVKEVFADGRSLDIYADFLRTARYLHEHEPEERLRAAETQEDINKKELMSPETRLPTQDEIKKNQHFFETGDEYFQDVLKEDEDNYMAELFSMDNSAFLMTETSNGEGNNYETESWDDIDIDPDTIPVGPDDYYESPSSQVEICSHPEVEALELPEFLQDQMSLSHGQQRNPGDTEAHDGE